MNYRGEYRYRSGSIKQLLKGQALNVTQDTTQVDIHAIENSIPMRIMKVIKENLALSQSQIAEKLGEKQLN